MTQEEIVHAPTITQQGSITQQRVEPVVQAPVPMAPEEQDTGPRAQYLGVWGAIMFDEEGDEGHEDDEDEPRHAASGGEEGHGSASDAGRSTAENFVESVGAPVFYIDWEDECKVAHSNLTHDRDITNGRDMMYAATALTNGRNQDADDDECGVISGIFFPSGFLRLFDGPSCRIADVWRTLDREASCAGPLVGTITAATCDPTTSRRRPHLGRRRLRLRRLQRLRRRLRQRRCTNHVATCDSTSSLPSPASSPFSLPLSLPTDLASDRSDHSDEHYARADRLRRALEQRKMAAHRWTPSVPP